ncbi:FecR family protein [Pseudoxanthomonas sp. CF125]|nr:FecR family protein [Pseudoxanthomonas sp. CF125]
MMGMRVSFDIGYSMRRRAGLLGGRCVLLLLLACSPLASAEDWSYRIRPGDTIWDLAGEYLKPGIPWQRLQAHNGISNPYQLPPGSTVRFPLAWLHLQPARARVIAVRGQTLVDGIGNGKAVAATEGMQLGVGALLRTARDATLTLEFADHTRLLLQGGSELRLDRLSQYGKSGMVDTRLRLQRGRITNSVTPSNGASPAFIVDTPNATSAVRGTRFRVNAEESRTQTEVTEGSVAVGAGSRNSLVRHGYGAVVAVGQATPIRAVPLLPAPDLSSVPATLNGARAEVKWRALEQARRYRVQASNTATFDTLLADLETTGPLANLPLLQDGVYFLRVRAIDAQGLEGYDATTRFVAETLPEPPFAIAPIADSLVREVQPEFHWADVADAAGYRFELADNAGFERPLSFQEKSTRTRAPQALAPGRYYWRIASDASNGRQGPYSDSIAFTVQPLPEAGEIEDETGDSRSVTFRWRAGEPGQRYRFQLSRSPDFKHARIDQVVDQSQITLPRLRAGTWYLRAQAIGSDGYEAPFPPAQRVNVPCGICKGVAAGGMLWILLAL